MSQIDPQVFMIVMLTREVSRRHLQLLSGQLAAQVTNTTSISRQLKHNGTLAGMRL
jgi:hypothetical protein